MTTGTKTWDAVLDAVMAELRAFRDSHPGENCKLEVEVYIRNGEPRAFLGVSRSKSLGRMRLQG